MQLAKEFASVPVPIDMMGAYGPVKVGQSFYAGDGNKAGHTVDETKEVFKESKRINLETNNKKITSISVTPSTTSSKTSAPTGSTTSGTTGSTTSGTTGTSVTAPPPVTKKPEGVTRVIGGIMDILSSQRTDFDQRGSFNSNMLPFMEQKESNVKTITKPRVVAPPPPIKRQPKVSVINGETTQQMASVGQAVTRVPELPAPPMSPSKVKLLGISIPV